MRFWESIDGTVTFQILSASAGEMLAVISRAGIVLRNVERTGDLSVRATVNRGDFKSVCKILQKRGDEYHILKRNGMYWSVQGLIGRPVLILFLIIYALLLTYLPTRILFLEVEGNHAVTTETILTEAEKCGIFFGASRRAVRSESMKNQLLAEIPQLQWAGVNTHGCVAVISVKERNAEPEKEVAQGIQSVIASYDGVIRQMTVLRGNPLCKPGQAVKEGQVLVSGYTDCGLSIKAEPAQAEIFADTIRNLDVVSPAFCLKRTDQAPVNKKYCLVIGKKLIKLFKDSGISDGTCVKMNTRYVLTLPGGFRLPVSLSEYRYAENHLQQTIALPSEDAVAHYAKMYLQGVMTAGTIVEANLTYKKGTDVSLLHGEYACREIIGQVRSEEIIQGNE